MGYAAAGLGYGIADAGSMISDALLGVEDRRVAQQERLRLAEERRMQQAETDAREGITRGYNSTIVETPELTPRSGETMFQGARLGGLGAAYGTPAEPTPLAPPSPDPGSVFSGQRMGLAAPSGRLQGLPGVAGARETIGTPQVAPQPPVQFGGPTVEIDPTRGTDFQGELAMRGAEHEQDLAFDATRRAAEAPEKAALLAQLPESQRAAASNMDLATLSEFVAEQNAPVRSLVPTMAGGLTVVDENDPASLEGVRPYHPTPGGASAGRTTAIERSAGRLAEAASAANTLLNTGVDEKLATLTGAASRGTSWFSPLANNLADEETQAAVTAGLNFINPTVKYLSGSAMPESETRRYMRSFLPAWGDKPATIAMKRAMRDNILTVMASGQFQGTPGPNGEPDLANIDAYIADFQARWSRDPNMNPGAGAVELGLEYSTTGGGALPPPAETPGQAAARRRRERQQQGGM